MGRVTASSETLGSTGGHPSGRTVTTAWDAAGRVASVSGSLNAAQTSYATLSADPVVAYSPYGTLAKLPLGNGVTETSVYNSRAQLTSMTAVKGAASLLSLGFTFGTGGTNNGNVLGQTIATSGGLSLSETYLYDPFNRLCGAGEAQTSWTQSTSCTSLSGTNDSWWQGYVYDQWGNRAVSGTMPNSDWTPTNLTKFTGNRWIRQTGGGDVYDADGNQTSVASNGSAGTASSTFAFDAGNRMVSSNVMGLGAVNYVYDGEGHRVEKLTGTTVTTVYAYDAAGTLTSEYGTAAVTAGTEYLTADHLGTTRLVTDQSGNVVRRYDYMPFGEEVGSGTAGRGRDYVGSGSYPMGPDPVTDVKFTGKERDAETGLDYFLARYMSSAQGRFTSPDPMQLMPQKLLDPQQWNMYGYARNNPLRFVDPTGMYVDGCVSGDKDCTKRIDKFEKARQKDLKSKNEAVRDAASQYGERGKANGVTVHVLTQPQMKAAIGQNANGATAPNSTTKGVDVYFDAALGGKDLQRTVAHEGTHLGMDISFIQSFDPATGKYDANSNFTILQTEFLSFMTGAAVKRYEYPGVACGGKPDCSFGPQEATKINEFLHNSPTYGPVLELPVFGTGRWPQ